MTRPRPRVGQDQFGRYAVSRTDVRIAVTRKGPDLHPTYYLRSWTRIWNPRVTDGVTDLAKEDLDATCRSLSWESSTEPSGHVLALGYHTL